MAKLPKKSDIKESSSFQTTIKSQHPRLLSCSRTPKLQCLKQHQCNTSLQPKGPAYWDNLSTIWLTKGALKELDQRNSSLKPRQEYCRPVTRQFDTKRKVWKSQFAPNFLRGCSSGCLRRLERLSRRGGPDLSDLRNVCDFRTYCYYNKTNHFTLVS